MRAIARFGALVDDVTRRGRALRVQVRVGDYAFDSSRFIDQNRGAQAAPGFSDNGMTAPLDDDYYARRNIWLMSDAAYKRAVSVFAKKKAVFQNRAATDTLPDFSREMAVETLLPVVPARADRGEWPDRVRQLSGYFSRPRRASRRRRRGCLRCVDPRFREQRGIQGRRAD